MIRVLAIVSVLAAFLSYVIYSPMPDGIAEPHKLMLFDGALRIQHHLGRVVSFFGIRSQPDMLRTVYENPLFGLQDPPKSMKAYFTRMDGIRVRVYEPMKRKTELLPGLMYFHGGGFVFGTLDLYDETLLNLARKLKIIIVSVDYRRAPEHKFPAAFKDCSRATRYLLNNAEQFNVDLLKIAVAGDSAGGNLAAAVALQLSKDINLPPLVFQALIYPVLQAVDFTLPSYLENEKATPGILADRRLIAWFLSNYALGNDSATDALLDGRAFSHIQRSDKSFTLDHVSHENIKSIFSKKGHSPPRMRNDSHISNQLYRIITNPTFAPLMAEDHELQQVPPAYILTAGFDMLRDDGILYLQRLEENNITVKWEHFHDGFHGMFMLGGGPVTFEVGRDARKSFIEYARHMLKFV
ncbi:neutral cholesterol ester hydrolase 1-like [Ptychodera flava]|uniref:neutral cholesterol ester hydrolase 1-like n=1 Tax=Ptychodera flava TaxID=63121 RepID=UPI00396A7CB1